MELDFHTDLNTLKATFDSSDEAAIYLDAITAHLPVSAIDLLDVGVGVGMSTMTLVHALYSKGYSVGLTMVDPAVPDTRKETLRLNGNLCETDLEHFAPVKPFDVVTATQVLYYLYLGDPRSALRRLVALPRSGGGLLALTTWTENCVLFDLYNRVFRSDRPCFTAEEAQSLLAEITGRVPTMVRSAESSERASGRMTKMCAAQATGSFQDVATCQITWRTTSIEASYLSCEMRRFERTARCYCRSKDV